MEHQNDDHFGSRLIVFIFHCLNKLDLLKLDDIYQLQIAMRSLEDNNNIVNASWMINLKNFHYRSTRSSAKSNFFIHSVKLGKPKADFAGTQIWYEVSNAIKDPSKTQF